MVSDRLQIGFRYGVEAVQIRFRLCEDRVSIGFRFGLDGVYKEHRLSLLGAQISFKKVQIGFRYG